MCRQLKAKKESIWRIRKTDRRIAPGQQSRSFVSPSVSQSHPNHNAEFDYELHHYLARSATPPGVHR